MSCIPRIQFLAALSFIPNVPFVAAVCAAAAGAAQPAWPTQPPAAQPPYAAQTAHAAQERPNILLILADDLGYADLGCTGSTFHQTPVLDQLARDGTLFRHAYAAAANCAPTRAALLSGQSSPWTGIYTVGSGARGKAEDRKLEPPPNQTELAPVIVTLAETLRDAGYRNGHFGKWHLGGGERTQPEAQGFAVNVGGSELGHPPSYMWPYARGKKRIEGLESAGEGTHLTTALTDAAIDFLEDQDDRPFFLYLPYYAVHSPIQPPPGSADKYRDKDALGKQNNPRYAALVGAMDTQIGRLLQRLEQLGLSKNTLVVFLSDNGGLGGYQENGIDQVEFTHNGPLRGGKGMYYEGGIRVPWIVRWPGRVAAGAVDDHPVHVLDLYTTFLGMIGGFGPSGQSLEGADLGPLWTGKVKEVDPRSLYWHFPGYLEGRNGTWRSTPCGAIRRGPYKLIEFFETGSAELYNLIDDPGESHDLSADLPEIKASLLADLQAWRERNHAPMPRSKSEFESGSESELNSEAESVSTTLQQKASHYFYDQPEVELEDHLVAAEGAYQAHLARLGSQLWSCRLQFTPGAGDRVVLAALKEDGSVIEEQHSTVQGRLARPTLTVDTRGRAWLSYEIQDNIDAQWRIEARSFSPSQGLGNPLRISQGPGNAIAHRVLAAASGGLAFVWQQDSNGQFDVCARFAAAKNDGSGIELAQVQQLSENPLGDWQPALAQAGDGALVVAWDRFNGSSYDVVMRWSSDGSNFGAPGLLAGGPNFQGRVRLAQSPAGRVWAAWEEGGPSWGMEFRGRIYDWNNVRDDYGPLHRTRRLRLAEIRSHGAKLVEVPMPGFQRPRDLGQREGVEDLGIYYERPELAVDAAERPWLVYRHYGNHQLGCPDPTVHHIEEGWRLYARCLGADGWSVLQGFASPQRDGMQRLALVPGADGIQALWTAGRSDRRKDPLAAGVAFGHAHQAVTPAPTPGPMTPTISVARPQPRRAPVENDGMQLFFGDLHRHTDLSLCFSYYDGSLEDAYRYAIDAAGLDFLGVTDHSRDLARGDVQSLLWWRSTKEVTRHRLRGSFFPYFAYERSHGQTDHNVISLRDDMLRNYPPPLPEFWEDIDDADTFTIPHNPFQGDLWEYQNDRKRPLLEIYQGLRDEPDHGPTHAHEGLDHGHHLGFIASSDHMSTSASYAGVWAPGADRVGIFRALQQRRTFGSTVPLSLVLRCERDGGGEAWMGERLRTAQTGLRFRYEIEASSTIRRVELIRDGEVWAPSHLGYTKSSMQGSWTAAIPAAGEHWYYLHVVLNDGNQAWSSPIWVERFAPPPPKAPNVVLIVADDLGWGDLSCYGQQRFTTPRLDGMAAQGMRFTQHYSGSTVCAPSRAVLMTGKHSGHAWVRGNRAQRPIGQQPLAAAEVTVAELLGGAGYRCAVVGKWGLGPPDGEGAPLQQGFDHSFGYNCQRNAHSYYPDHLFRDDLRLPLAMGTWSHELMTEDALAFLDQQEEGRPFFLYVPFTIPHAGLEAPDEVIAPFLGAFEETPFAGGHYAAQETPRAAYAGMITRMDRDVGLILDRLRARGLADNTLVLFTSDNGPHREGGADPAFFDSNGPFRGVKRDLYEGGIRVPMIAWWPGQVAENSVSGHASAFWDFLPTVCELAGVEVPEDCDGLSFVPELLGEPQSSHESLYWEFHEGKGAQALLQGDWKAVRKGVKRDASAAVELYNLAQDPGERTDLAAQHPDISQQMLHAMMQERTRADLWPLAIDAQD